MKNILLILTGGTIGSTAKDGIIDVNKGNVSNTFTDILNNYKDKVVFSIRRPFTILSENMHPSYWNVLVRTIYRELNSEIKYDGVIIAHGSDTLSYTSALTALFFAGGDIPIILTAANYPLEDSRSNGSRNLKACIDYIIDHCEHTDIEHIVYKDNSNNSVYTIYEDNCGNMNVYNAHTICEADGYLDSYHDLTGIPYGCMKEGRLIINYDYVMPDSYRSLSGAVCGNCDIQSILCKTADMTDNVLMIRPYPGFRYDSISFDRYRPACVLHGLYHAGTAATDSGNDDNSIIAFLDYCKKEAVPLYVVPVKNSDVEVYASHSRLIDAGAIPLYDMNYETAYALLLVNSAL